MNKKTFERFKISPRLAVVGFVLLALGLRWRLERFRVIKLIQILVKFEKMRKKTNN